MSRIDFLSVAREMAENAPSEAEVASAGARLESYAREQRLVESDVLGAITEEDRAQIVADKMAASTHALATVKRWVVSRDQSPRPLTTLALVGETGRGKTVAGAWLIARLGGTYVTAEDVRQMVRSGKPQDSAALSKLLASRVLVLDDAGTEEMQGAELAMFQVVNKRTGLARGWTLITANLPEPEFRSRYGERTMRRIEHQGAIVTVTGEDLRRKAKR